MERITMSIDAGLAKAFDELIAARGYTSRSEAMRDMLRREVEGQRQDRDPKTYCVASLSYVYDHHARNLAERLTEAQHAHHDLVTATMHVHLDHDNCMENVMLRGPTVGVRAFADRILAQRGVRHGQLNIITVEAGDAHSPAVGKYHHHHGHLHLIPRS
jgi:CopG family nickel-responsive transcriptional regulator